MIPRVYGRSGQPVRLEGCAYDFGHAISAIQFSLDEGKHWTEYATERTTDYQNLTWAFEFTPPQPGFYRMRIRAVNDRGEASPKAAHVELEID
ncbi:molybdopterin-binding protein [Arabiibacter massiliensis]|uniref:molybdopterin-binding protein n=1 Tax=Arabiibacter massiliensis TaxID=1870985 RepID=UPI00117A0BB1|nr:molybdopterin-binding protein [Arabiibacter massiliensis]